MFAKKMACSNWLKWPFQAWLLFGLYNSVIGKPASNKNEDQQLIVILMDGFRWDYPEFSEMFGFRKMETEGARAKYMEPIYPSLSYPNYYSLTTGRYPESHGFVGNIMYDSALNEFFKMEPHRNTSSGHWWHEAEPIWITATKNGRKTSLYRWPGCQVEHGDVRPFYCVPYSYLKGVDDFRRDLDQAVSDIEDQGVRLSMVYVEHADKVGHRYGPKSSNIRQAVHELDNVLLHFLNNLESKQLNHKVNVIVVSDHGMMDTSPEQIKLIQLSSVIDLEDVEYILDTRAYTGIIPVNGKLEKIFNALKVVEGLDVYKKDEIPERLHLKHHSRTPSLILAAKPGYYMEGFHNASQQVPPGPAWDMDNTTVDDDEPKQFSGTHGYDPYNNEDMRGIFFASGPAFNSGYAGGPIKIVDVYNVMADIINIKPLPNKGSGADMTNFLKTLTFKSTA